MPTTTTRHWLRAADCHLADLLTVLQDQTDLADYPHATRVAQGVPVYDAQDLRGALGAGEGEAIEEELCRAWSDGPGIVVIAGAFTRVALDPVTAAYEAIIADEKAAGGPRGDHFGKPGANDRIWNALEKLAVRDPEAFVDYYANDMLALGARAWLGPGYQVTAQANIVRPGGAGQTVHRDYHLGFMDAERAARYPAHVHAFSAQLTLQGAVAHVDMPVASGPTLYLPHSQKYPLGYLAYHLPQFQEYFLAHHVQLPLAAGDLVWFNPALFHAAGSNVSSDIQRMANLLQVSSPFGRAMESVDRARVVASIHPTLTSRVDAGMPLALVENVIAASAEGYPFPSNLDRAQPVGGMAPPSQADLVRVALAEGLDTGALVARLGSQAATIRSHDGSGTPSGIHG